MAALRTAFRSAPRAHLLRPTPTASPTAHIAALARRNYAGRSAVSRPASDDKDAEQAEAASEDIITQEGDPNMNGDYPDPSKTSALPIKRSLRDPYEDWWDPIERRNYGEDVHEDNDILGVFSTEEYTHFTPRWGGVLMASFVGAVGVLLGLVYRFYPDRPSAPRTFPGGLEAELGGPGAVRARMEEDEDGVL